MKYITATTEKRIMKAASKDSFGFTTTNQGKPIITGEALHYKEENAK